MNGYDIELCDNLELIAFIASETEYYCATVKDCGVCPCKYDDDTKYNCRKDHLNARKSQLEKGSSGESIDVDCRKE
ncbi:MAG: hypothetical protein J6C07_09695 [Lachnospiraceae bacterium]|nr:hypothetical protein [Lachnospiraceae bacterium]